MPQTIVDSVIAGSTDGGNSVTTAAIDATTATALYVAVASWAAQPEPTLSDSEGNTYTPLTVRDDGVNRVRWWVCASPTVDAAHTFSVSGGTATYPSVAAYAVSGTAASPVDQQSGATGTGTSLAAGSVTPTEDDELVLVAVCYGASDVPSIGGGYTLDHHHNNDPGQSFGLDAASLIQTTATATNPTWTFVGSLQAATAAATFKVAAAGGGQPMWKRFGGVMFARPPGAVGVW